MRPDAPPVVAAALVTLAERGIRPDIQELLVYGDPMRGIRPGALAAALVAAHAATKGTADE